MQSASPLTDAILEWNHQVERLLPKHAKLVEIDSPPFSASTATTKAVLHLRAVHVPGHSNDGTRNECLLERLKTVGAVDDASHVMAQEILGWPWTSHVSQTQISQALPQTPHGKQTRPENAPPQPKRSASAQLAGEMTPPHQLFLTMVSNIRYRQPTSKPDDTEAYTFAHALGPFGQPWIKYRHMDNTLNPQNTPPRLTVGSAGPAGPTRGLSLFRVPGQKATKLSCFPAE